MNISPVSFGKVVEVRGKTKLTASNIASLANSSVENKTHSAIQKDAKELFDDVTPKAKVRVYEAPSGEQFLLGPQVKSTLSSPHQRRKRSAASGSGEPRSIISCVMPVSFITWR